MVKDHSDSEKGNPLPTHRPVHISSIMHANKIVTIAHDYFCLDRLKILYHSNNMFPHTQIAPLTNSAIQDGTKY